MGDNAWDRQKKCTRKKTIQKVKSNTNKMMNDTNMYM